MDFAWSQEQRQLREAIYELARAELNEGLLEREARGEFNHRGWKLLAGFGIQGMPIPEAWGGMGLDALTCVGVLESLGHGCKDNGLVFSANAHMWTAALPILDFGSEAQKRRYLPGLCDGSLIGGNAMTEPEAGSDAYSLATRADKRGDRYVLNGSKVYITNGSIADVLVVFATVDPSKGANGISAFLVEKGFKGFQAGPPMKKMGTRTSPTSEVYLDDCEVPETNRLGKEGAGKMLFAHSMTWERACILASAVGSMQRLLDASIAHARTRRQFGTPIGQFQRVADRIVDMKLRVETARGLLYRAAWLRDQRRSIFLEAAMTKLHISECWVACAEDAIQIHGGAGYMQDQEIERELRDAIGSRIYSGTSEIQRALIASLLGL
jgi:alkylation response protein AidB-like acyl-CoA dehydrogenase